MAQLTAARVRFIDETADYQTGAATVRSDDDVDDEDSDDDVGDNDDSSDSVVPLKPRG